MKTKTIKQTEEFIKALPEPEDQPEECKGLFYRGKTNAFLNNNNEYVYQERTKLLKRLSCPGCDVCMWLYDMMEECIANDTLPIIDNVVNGELYRLKVVNEIRDWEFGIIDDWDLEFVLVTPPLPQG